MSLTTGADLLLASAGELLAAYAAGTTTPLDVAETVLAQIERVDPVVRAVADVAPERVREQARASASRWAAGQPLGALDGVPLTLKDSVNSAGERWRHGCAAYGEGVVAEEDSLPASRIRGAGGLVVARTTMPDLGLLAAGLSSVYGTTRNPWDTTRSPGGSSSGAGAALATGIGAVAVGTDIAGSVRLPASQCGVASLKPTQGRVPHLPPSTMRTAGPMARTVADVARLFAVLSEPDPRDVLSVYDRLTVPDQLPAPPPGTRIGLVLDMGYGPAVEEDVARVVRAAADAASDAGYDVVAMPAPFDDDPYPPLDRVFQLRALCELDLLAPADAARTLDAVARWAARAAGTSAVAAAADLAEVAASALRVQQWCARVDHLISPVLPAVGFAATEPGLDPDVPLAHATFTAWFNQTGQPAAVVPFGTSSAGGSASPAGMPIGVQVVGRRGADVAVLGLAHLLEQARPALPPHPLEPLGTGTGG